MITFSKKLLNAKEMAIMKMNQESDKINNLDLEKKIIQVDNDKSMEINILKKKINELENMITKMNKNKSNEDYSDINNAIRSLEKSQQNFNIFIETKNSLENEIAFLKNMIDNKKN